MKSINPEKEYIKIYVTPELDADGKTFKSVENYEFKKEPLKWIFIPTFNELPVALMAYLLALIAYFQPGIKTLIAEFGLNYPVIILLPVIFYVWLAGLSWLHVLTGARKLQSDKKTLVFFAAVCCILSGLLGGYRLYQYGPNSWIQFFGAWNMFQGLILIFLLKLEIIGEKQFSNRDTPFIGTIINMVFITAIFFVLKDYFDMHWIDNFSICVAYATTLSTFICDQVASQPQILPPTDQKIDCSKT
ncbi:MAG: hypothetical protein KKB51_02810 [Candidatus Riflebacteria bacterium]|nr:hypothetical protein [Candidatus Riflebacteria bacterium]